MAVLQPARGTGRFVRIAGITDGELADRVDVATAACNFSGVIRVDREGGVALERACGFADRRWSVPMTTDMRLSIASGAKGFTALAVMALVESGQLALDTKARSLLGSDLPLIHDDVTIEQLLGHRSGIGDYLDEETMGDISEHVMRVPVHELDSAEAYLAVLDGFPQVAPPGTQFAYNNGGYVVLALLAERAAGRPYHDLVDELVVQPAGLSDTGFIRSDALPANVATGYLDREGVRTNALHLPVLGAGDGGMISTTADMAGFWTALYDARIVSAEHVELMTRPHSDAPEHRRRYGLGFWLAPTGPTVFLEGYDAGVSFRSMHDPTMSTTRTVISNTSEGAWDLLRAVSELREP
jgi:CubicO group peptidase (beta-lactamase class C family)